MVKYIPELGLVIAASQKGRVAIISLTWQEEVGFAFRIDWIVPFYTQERNDDRPMIPLLGLAVSPMPGYEIPPDVPCIPQGVDPNDWLTFNYRTLDPDENEAPPPPSSSSNTSIPPKHQNSTPTPDPRAVFRNIADPGSTSGPESECEPDLEQHSSSNDSHSDTSDPENDPQRHTLAELHAQASYAYHPRERWHGWHPSRHYRLLLLFCDHTVMSYEFWHDWKN